MSANSDEDILEIRRTLELGLSDIPSVTVANILINTALSGGVQINGQLAGIIIPPAWTAAAVTFQGSLDGVTYYDLYDDGVERTIASASVVANRFLSLPLINWLGVKYLKLRSGTAAAAVNQVAARSISLVLAG